jgi:hypothetical protein
MSKYTPDCWVKVKFTNDEFGEIEKIFAGWYGGYLNGDSWKLSSGITQQEEFDDRYEFTNSSGSVYVCYKGSERMSGLMGSVYASFAEQIREANEQNSTNKTLMEIIPVTGDSDVVTS